MFGWLSTIISVLKALWSLYGYWKTFKAEQAKQAEQKRTADAVERKSAGEQLKGAKDETEFDQASDRLHDHMRRH